MDKNLLAILTLSCLLVVSGRGTMVPRYHILQYLKSGTFYLRWYRGWYPFPHTGTSKNRLEADAKSTAIKCIVLNINMKYNISVGTSNIYLAHMAPRKEHLGTNNVCQLGTEILNSNSKGFSDSGIGTWLLATAALAESHWSVQVLAKARLAAAGASSS